LSTTTARLADWNTTQAFGRIGLRDPLDDCTALRFKVID
jgi:hypothetical protein